MNTVMQLSEMLVYHVLCAIAYLRLAKLQQMYKFGRQFLAVFGATLP